VAADDDANAGVSAAGGALWKFSSGSESAILRGAAALLAGRQSAYVRTPVGSDKPYADSPSVGRRRSVYPLVRVYRSRDADAARTRTHVVKPGCHELAP
jgi:hypothetical protein